ncbi:MAG TPA: insulinase family protein [Xanthobacteraceae bacterium]
MAVHGFELLQEQTVAETGSTARFYRHARTGAELLSLANQDENKVFGVTFRTPPKDSTGVAHILEHSVLCGSRKYPIKKPFVELKKGSLNTFLNAFTFPDMTCYPVASQNLQDFYNLIDVYLDAVFFPQIARETFEQEGWHYEMDSIASPLAYKGVVFNEMKGNYSSPDNVLQQFSNNSLYPDITYGLDSGGDPRHIPDLSYEQLKAFHARHYHPSNARLFFYGDDDPTERLARLDDCLRAFDPIKIDSAVGLQPRFAAPKRFSKSYAAEATNKAMITVNWMLDEIVDVELGLAFDILSYILTGTPASPLHKALIDSGLGEAHTGGLNSQLRQPSYTVGLKGIDPGDADKVEALILETLGGLAEKGIERPVVEAAMNINEFLRREYNTGSFPRGIAMMITALQAWLYDRDPVTPLAFEKPLGAIKARLAQGDRYFEHLIKEHLLHNRHRTTVLVKPAPEQADREAAAERARLDAVRAHMSAADVEAVVETTHNLRRLQTTPDPPEALAVIPTLQLADLPKRSRLIPLVEDRTRDTRVLFHDLATNQVIYLDIAFDLHRLPGDLLPYMPLFGRALLETGVGEHDFVEVSQRIDRSTGGIYSANWTSATRTPGTSVALLVLRAKTMPDKTAALFGILEDVLTKARLDNRERFRQLVLEAKASQEAALAPAGSAFVSLRLQASSHEAHWASEQIGGISHLFFLRDLAQRVETDWDSVRAVLERIRSLLIDRAGMVCNITTDAGNWRRFEPQLAAFLDRLPISRVISTPWQIGAQPACEGLAIPTTVNFVGKGGDIDRLGYQPTGAIWVVMNHLNTTWLWDKVRVEGGAYGASCHYDTHAGNFAFVSYRDPNLQSTLDIYDKSADFLRAAPVGGAELTRSIIGVIGAIDTYRMPDAKGWTSMANHLIGVTDDFNQRRREEILSTSPSDFRNLADVLAELAVRANVAVMGSEQAIAQANARRQDLLQVTKVM